MSQPGWKAEVIAAGETRWSGNGLVFGSPEEAEDYVADLKRRWTLVVQTRVVPADEEPNYRLVNGQAVRIEA